MSTTTPTLSAIVALVEDAVAAASDGRIAPAESVALGAQLVALAGQLLHHGGHDAAHTRRILAAAHVRGSE